MYPFIAEHYWIEHQVLVIQIDFTSMTKSLLRTLLSNSGVNSLDLGCIQLLSALYNFHIFSLINLI